MREPPAHRVRLGSCQRVLIDGGDIRLSGSVCLKEPDGESRREGDTLPESEVPTAEHPVTNAAGPEPSRGRKCALAAARRGVREAAELASAAVSMVGNDSHLPNLQTPSGPARTSVVGGQALALVRATDCAVGSG